MLHRFVSALAVVAMINAPRAATPRHKYAHPIADQMTTAAIDIAAKAIETRMSHVPADGQIEIAFAPVP